MSILEMKSLASSDVSTNSGSSKLHLQAKMLFSVSLSSSPRKGQRPLRLSGRDGRELVIMACVWMCLCACGRVYLQHVGDDAEAPHVSVERHKVVVDDFRSEKLRSAEIHTQFLPWFISMWRTQLKLHFEWWQNWIKSRSKRWYLHPRQTKIDDFDLICDSAHAQNVLRLKCTTKERLNFEHACCLKLLRNTGYELNYHL